MYTLKPVKEIPDVIREIDPVTGSVEMVDKYNLISKFNPVINYYFGKNDTYDVKFENRVPVVMIYPDCFEYSNNK